MATCKDCLHYGVCIFHITKNENKKCPHFKDKSHYAEVKHGEWIMCGGRLYCSVCGERACVTRDWEDYWYTEGTNHCPNCGAKMDGGKDG